MRIGKKQNQSVYTHCISRNFQNKNAKISWSEFKLSSLLFEVSAQYSVICRRCNCQKCPPGCAPGVLCLKIRCLIAVANLGIILDFRELSCGVICIWNVSLSMMLPCINFINESLLNIVISQVNFESSWFSIVQTQLHFIYLTGNLRKGSSGQNKLYNGSLHGKGWQPLL